MGKRGPQPKPTVLKVIEGNRGKRKLPQDPTPAISPDCPKPPEWLKDERAVAFWEQNAPALHACGLLTMADVSAFALVADTYARLRKAMDDVDERGTRIKFISSQGKEQTVPNESIREANELRMQYQRLSSSFGMNPSARSGLAITKPKTAQEKLKASLGSQ